MPKRDRARHLRVRQVPQPGQLVSFTTEVPLAVGIWSLGLALEQQRDSAGEALRDPEVPIPDAVGKRLELSDIVLGDGTGGCP